MEHGCYRCRWRFWPESLEMYTDANGDVRREYRCEQIAEAVEAATDGFGTLDVDGVAYVIRDTLPDWEDGYDAICRRSVSIASSIYDELVACGGPEERACVATFALMVLDSNVLATPFTGDELAPYAGVEADVFDRWLAAAESRGFVVVTAESSDSFGKALWRTLDVLADVTEAVPSEAEAE